jgi:hypothetical protein
MHDLIDDIEIGSPEKFSSVIGGEDWSIDELIKFGIFKNDKRLSKQQIIYEIKALDRYNTTQLHSSFFISDSSVLRDTIKTIRSKENWNEEFIEQIISIIRYEESVNLDQLCIIDCYFPKSFVGSIHHAIFYQEEAFISRGELVFFSNDEKVLKHYSIDFYVEEDERTLSNVKKAIETKKIFNPPVLSSMFSIDDDQLLNLWNYKIVVSEFSIYRDGDKVEGGKISSGKFRNNKFLKTELQNHEGLESIVLLNSNISKLIFDKLNPVIIIF